MNNLFLHGCYDYAILVLRITIGCFMLFGHGLKKLLSFKEKYHSFFNPIGLGSEASYLLSVFAETVCSGLLILGLFTRISSLILMLNMSVIVLFVQLRAPWQKKEPALLYLLCYLTLVLTGPGRYSLDFLLFP